MAQINTLTTYGGIKTKAAFWGKCLYLCCLHLQDLAVFLLGIPKTGGSELITELPALN